MFFTLLLIALLAYLLWPVVKGMMYVRKVQRNVRDAFEQATRGNGSGAGRASGSSGTRKKKFGKDVGEYVEFEEVSVSSGYRETSDAPAASSRQSGDAETQVVDAEWEDLPPK